MAKTFFDVTSNLNVFADAMGNIYSQYLRIRRWHRHLDENGKEKFKELYQSFADNICTARADLGALMAEYMVHVAGTLAEKESEEEQS